MIKTVIFGKWAQWWTCFFSSHLNFLLQLPSRLVRLSRIFSLDPIVFMFKITFLIPAHFPVLSVPRQSIPFIPPVLLHPFQENIINYAKKKSRTLNTQQKIFKFTSTFSTWIHVENQLSIVNFQTITAIRAGSHSIQLNILQLQF